MTEELPDWTTPPRLTGWEADDLDHLPEAPKHIELIDGALIFRLLPQQQWCSRVTSEMASALVQAAPAGLTVVRQMTVRLDKQSRTEPDILVTTAPCERDRTWFAPEDVPLIVEVASPESAARDRSIKPFKYAQAGIPNFWRIEEEGEGEFVVHVYELDTVTNAYVPTGIHRERLKVSVPFPLDIDLAALAY
ncbi:Uma2 family endonuclease [Streptomyces sp. NPDC004539]|uniref:Uma2 family endonuclease n=1 Tax=Streptomyces sp. NPDC004539 TaxID=3154280 RepID=UPI0033B415CC